MIYAHCKKTIRKYCAPICEKCSSLIDIAQANVSQMSRQDSANTRGNLGSALVIIIAHHTDTMAITYSSIPEIIYIKVCRLP